MKIRIAVGGDWMAKICQLKQNANVFGKKLSFVRNEHKNRCWVAGLDGEHMSSFVRFLQLWRAGNLFPIVFLHIFPP